MSDPFKKHRVSADQARKLAATPAFQNMVHGMMLQETARLVFGFLDKKPGRKVVIVSSGTKGQFDFDFLEPDGSQSEDL